MLSMYVILRDQNHIKVLTLCLGPTKFIEMNSQPSNMSNEYRLIKKFKQ